MGGGMAVPRGIRIKDWLSNRMLKLMISETEENFDKEHGTQNFRCTMVRTELIFSWRSRQEIDNESYAFIHLVISP